VGAPVGDEAVLLVSGLELRVDMEGLVNFEEEKKRLDKEIAKVEDDLNHVRGKLEKPSFIDKAPPALIEKERAKETEYAAKLKELQSALARVTASIKK
jgi:valyl-tRNA synthetase